MSVTIIATVGATNSNSYCTLTEADTYHEERLHVDDWDNAGSNEKNSALVWATRILDEQVDWDGYKRSDAQALRWPRSYVYDTDGYPIDSSTIPQWLKNATAELARNLITGDRTLDTNYDTKGFKSIQIGDLKMVMDTYTGKAVIPKSVWSIIKPYCKKIGKQKTLVRM